MLQEVIEILHRSSLRENCGSEKFVETKTRSSRSPQELEFVRIEYLRKIVLVTSLVSGGVPIRFLWPVPSPSYGKAPLERHPSSVSKEVVVYVHEHLHRITRNKYYLPKQMDFICPVIETSENVEPNDNDLELNAIVYTFS